MIRLSALALMLGMTGAVYAADPPKPEPPKPEEKKPADPEETFKKKDKDKDGKLTLEEFKGKATGEMATKAEARFKKMDKDSDGKLTLEEFKAGQPKKKA